MNIEKLLNSWKLVFFLFLLLMVISKPSNEVVSDYYEAQFATKSKKSIWRISSDSRVVKNYFIFQIYLTEVEDYRSNLYQIHSIGFLNQIIEFKRKEI